MLNKKEYLAFDPSYGSIDKINLKLGSAKWKTVPIKESGKLS
jgi:hypothetical protein